MDSKQIDVMVADASHEVYVDKILDTIREAGPPMHTYTIVFTIIAY